MPDSLEKTLKFLMKAGLLPTKNKKKRRKNKKRQQLKNNGANFDTIRQNNKLKGYGIVQQPNLSSLSVRDQLAFIENRDKEIEKKNNKIEYKNNLDNILNPHLNRITDKINDTNTKLLKFQNDANFYANDLYNMIDNKTRFDNINDNNNIYTDNIDVATVQGSDNFPVQGLKNDPNDLVFPDGDMSSISETESQKNEREAFEQIDYMYDNPGEFLRKKNINKLKNIYDEEPEDYFNTFLPIFKDKKN